jgi:UPF0716 protein FxsA
MLALLIAFVVVPLVEIYVLVKVGQQIGALYAIGLLLGLSIFGAWLAKREGFALFGRLQQTLAAGRMPTNELIDGVLILVGGVLLFVPGFVTDAFGLLLLFPPIRYGVRTLVKRRFRLQLVDRADMWRIERAGPRYDGPDDVIDV